MIYDRIFILTGAGISAESGLGTFRDKGGLWSEFKIEEVATIEGYRRDPKKVLDFYNFRRAKHRDVAPNAAHAALAKLQQGAAKRGRAITLCTQNIDNLHERAGSTDVIHMHGEIGKSRCGDCGDVRASDGELLLDLGCPACGRIGGLRPHVVWFGEMPLEMDRIYEELALADLFVSIGTSGAVYPAAGFVAAARRAGIATLELNLEPSENAEMFDGAHYGPASEVVPAWVRDVLND
ncbi:NAD-dependent protein deacetylase of SIR2 family [alpha proteobacterium U9-1i]|nr:NAD-dependent protein deacetylase of SIR2 family [alpha proteobacterium U9-1i]